MAKGKKKEEKKGRIINLARELPTPNSSLKTTEQEPSKKKEDN
jgi:hypothetical protein